jgi:hypothetical protein
MYDPTEPIKLPGQATGSHSDPMKRNVPPCQFNNTNIGIDQNSKTE